MVAMMMMIFQGFFWAWPPHIPPSEVLESQTFTTDGKAPAGNPILASISRLLRHAGEDSGSILLTPEPQGARVGGRRGRGAAVWWRMVGRDSGWRVSGRWELVEWK